MRQHVASFANFICHFGEKKVLLDYAEEIVLPAFTDDTLIRSYGETHFFFYESKIFVFDRDSDEPTIAVSGRFIKNTKLSREQIFDPNKGLVKDSASLASAPSVQFVLILNNHRLIYFPETAHAPDLRAFRATAERFLREKHKSFIDRKYKDLRANDEKVTKKELWEIHPQPTLELVPISGGDEISDFVRRYAILKKIEFRLIQPNDEIDGGEIYNEIRTYLGPLRPSDTRLVASRNEGLDIDAALPRIKEATETANQEVRLTGVDENGNKLPGDNHAFKIGAPVEPIPGTRRKLVEKLLQIFDSLQEAGVIKTGSRSEQVTERIREIIQTL